MDFYKGTIPILDDSTGWQSLAHPQGVAYGAVQRDYAQFPDVMFAHPDEMELIPESEWDARFDEQEEKQSSLEHIYLGGPGGAPRFVNLNQGSNGYCWMFSKGHCMMLERLRSNLPIIRLNPCAVAAIIKRGADEGGWCGLGVDMLKTMGMPTERTWPGNSRSLSHDTPEMRSEAMLHRIVEDWYDLTKQVYDQKLTDQQIATCTFNNNPVAADFMWWAHSVCVIRWVRIEPNSWGKLILNAWLNWGRYGLAVLRGDKAKADGAISIRVTTPSTT